MSANTRIVRSTLVLLCAALLSTSCGSKTMETATDVATVAAPVLGSIAQTIPGLSQAQAILGAGSLLGFADAKMPDAQFDQLESAIPGAESLMKQAQGQGLPKQLNGFVDVSSFLGKAGITPDQTAQIVDVLANSVKGKVPDEVVNTFVATLK